MLRRDGVPDRSSPRLRVGREDRAGAYPSEQARGGVPMTDPLERPERLSQTFLRRWKQCPRLAHLERQVGPSSDVAVIGSVCHSIFAAVGMATALEGHTKPSPARAEHIAMHYLGSPDAAGL